MSVTAMRSDASRRAVSRDGSMPARRCGGARRGEELCAAQYPRAIAWGWLSQGYGQRAARPVVPGERLNPISHMWVMGDPGVNISGP